MRGDGSGEIVGEMCRLLLLLSLLLFHRLVTYASSTIRGPRPAVVSMIYDAEIALCRMVLCFCVGEDAVAIDNTGAVAISQDPAMKSGLKHVQRRHYFVRDMVENGEISPDQLEQRHLLIMEGYGRLDT